MTNDPFASAFDPVLPALSADVYGEVAVDLWFCTLKKGVGKAPYIDGQDRPADRRIAIDINIADLSGNNYDRKFINEIPTDGWRAITLPSMLALGINDARALNGVWVHAVMEPYGEYTDKNGDKKPRTAPRIVAIYRNREECEAAAQGAATQTSIFDGAAPNANGNGTANSNGTNGNIGADAERAVALAFLPAIVAGCRSGNGIDHARLTAALAGNPILARHFTLASPEVSQAMEQVLSEPAF